MDPLHHHHHHHAPLHWGYSGTAVAHPQHHHQHTWVPPPTGTSAASTTTIPATQGSGLSSRKLKRAMSESDCEDLYSEESSKDQTSPGESDSCHMMSRKKRRGVIEKKRRDRINLSLCELKRLVPSAYEKQGSAKLEKAEILQLTVDHLKTLQHKGADGMPFDAQRFAVDYHIVGFRECASEVARYLVTMEGMDIQDPLRLRLMSHLQCFMAQRELQLKSNSGSSADLLSPNPTASSSASVGPAIVNPVSPNMDHTSSNWSSSTAYHQQAAYQMMPSTTGYPNAYASQTATGGGGYVPNLPPPLPQQYDQYGNQRSTTESSANNSNYGASDANLSSTRSGVTTRSQANNSSSTGTAANSSDVNNGGSSSADQSGPTYTDLSSSSASSASVTTSSASTTAVSASVVGVNNNNRVQSNYNVYGHIHYPADPSAFGGHHHHGYNLHLDPSRGYNGGQGNGTGAAGANAKPYRPWGAEMAY